MVVLILEWVGLNQQLRLFLLLPDWFPFTCSSRVSWVSPEDKYFTYDDFRCQGYNYSTGKQCIEGAPT